VQVEKLIRQAVAEIKSKWQLPSSGFIAGGSIANLVWEYVSGKKAVVNDIDVFITSEGSEEADSFEWQKKEIQYTERYSHLIQSIFVKEKYRIYNVTRDGMLNFIYVSNEANPLKILRSFDINATCAGYSIDEDKCYYLPQFEDFLNSGKLKIANLMTPSHTAIRLAKKEKDLGIKTDDFEFSIIQVCLYNKWLPDFNRFRFQNKYAELFHQHSDRLLEFFTIECCPDVENYLERKLDKKVNIWELRNKKSLSGSCTKFSLEETDFASEFFLSASHKFQLTTDDLLFYFRNIYGDAAKDEVWQKLVPFYKHVNYLDTDNPDEIKKLTDFISSYPSLIKNLSGWTMTEQIKIIENVMNSIGKAHSIEAAVRVLESNRITPDMELGEFEVMTLLLSVRKKIARKETYYLDINGLPF